MKRQSFILYKIFKKNLFEVLEDERNLKIDIIGPWFMLVFTHVNRTEYYLINVVVNRTEYYLISVVGKFLVL